MGMIIVGWIADRLGLSKLLAEIIMIATLVVVIVIAGFAIRQHYVNEGWNKALVAVKKQDDKAVAAAVKVEKKAAACQDGINGYWDVITQSCKLEDAQ
jgi:hypothetical protein